MYISYLLYQAERPRSAAEQRAEDVSRGELAKALSRVLHGRGQASQAAPAPASSQASPAAPAPASSQASPAAPARPPLTLVKGTGKATAAQCVPAQRNNRTAC